MLDIRKDDSLSQLQDQFVKADPIDDMDIIRAILDAMHTYGGSFVKQLAELYEHGDLHNKRKILSTWPNYFAEYYHQFAASR